MKTMRKHFWIYSLAAICVALVLTLGCERERLFEPELSSHGMFEGVDLQINPLSIPDGERYLIGFHTTPDISVVKGVGGEVYRTFTIVPAVAARLSPRAVEALEKNPNVRYVEPDHEVFAHSQTVPWGIDRVFGDESYSFDTWGITRGGRIAVAILDTGIDENHEDLPKLLGGVNTIDDTHWGSDGSGHGTHVAGTVAALDNTVGVVGVGPEIGLYAVKVLSDGGSGSVSSVVAGINWAVNNNIPVLNMSLGSSSDATTMREACNNAYNAGHLLVASAGNSGNPAGRGDNVGYPAKYSSVIAVAASDINDRRASFSSTGPAVELIAPGVSVRSTLPGDSYGNYSGTSMASPHVAGVAALAWAVNSTLTNVEIREILQETAEDLGLSSNHQGYGLARADLAVKKAATQEGVEIASVAISPESHEDSADVGQDVVYEFTVKNTGDVDDIYDVSVNSDWSSSVNKNSVSLAAGATITIEVTHSVPGDASPGDFDTGILEVISSKSTGASASAKFTITARGYAVEITPGSQSKTGAPGEMVEYIYTISNTGTENDEYSFLTITVWESSVNTSSINVNAGTSQEVTVTHTIPEGAEGDDSDKGTLTVSSNNASGSAEFTTIAREDAETDDPVIDVFTVTNTSNPAWARVTVDWTVSGSNLARVKSEMLLNGELIDTQTSSVSGDQASGTHELRSRGGHGKTYDIKLTVTDAADNSVSETEPITL